MDQLEPCIPVPVLGRLTVTTGTVGTIAPGSVVAPNHTALIDPSAALTALCGSVRGFATSLKPTAGNDAKLTEWFTTARAIELPHLRSFTNGLAIDRSAMNASRTLLNHDGRTEGVNTRTRGS